MYPKHEFLFYKKYNSRTLSIFLPPPKYTLVAKTLLRIFFNFLFLASDERDVKYRQALS